MSYRQNISEINITPSLNDLINLTGIYAANIKSEQLALSGNLSAIAFEINSLVNFNSPSSPSIINEKIESILQNAKVETKNDPNETLAEILNIKPPITPVYIANRIDELKKQASDIVTVDIPRIIRLRKFLEFRYSTMEFLLNTFQQILNVLDTILEFLDDLIQSVGSTPVIGPVLQSILSIIRDIIEEKLFYPLKNSITQWKKSIEASKTLM